MADHNITVFIRGDASSLTKSLQQAQGQLNAFGKRTGAAGGQAAAGIQKTSQAMHQLNQGSGVAVDRFARYNAALNTGSKFMAIWRSQASMGAKVMQTLGAFALQTATIMGGFIAVNTAIRGITGAVSFAAEAFMSFNSEMTESMAIMGDISSTFEDRLNKAVIENSKVTKYTAAQSAEALYFLASAGLGAAGAMEALPVVTKFAQAGVMDLAKATEYLVDVTTSIRGPDLRDQYGLIDPEKTKQAMQEVSDVIIKAAVDSNATVEQMAEALQGKVGGMARSLDKPIEEMASLAEAFASVGIKGKVANQQIYQVMRDLQKAANQNAGAFHDMGVEVYDAQGNVNNMGTIMTQLGSALGGMSDAQRKASLTMLGFQERSQAALISILDMGPALIGFQNGLENAGGTTEDVANRQLESLSNKIQLVKNQLGALAIAGGQNFLVGLKTVGDILSPVIANLKKAGENIIKSLEPIVKVFGQISKITIGAGLMGIAAILTPILTLLNKFSFILTVIADVALLSLIQRFYQLGPVAAVLTMLKTQFLSLATTIKFTALELVGFETVNNTLVRTGGLTTALRGAFSNMFSGIKAGFTSLLTAQTTFEGGMQAGMLAAMLIYQKWSAAAEDNKRKAREGVDAISQGIDTNKLNEGKNAYDKLVMSANAYGDAANKAGEAAADMGATTQTNVWDRLDASVKEVGNNLTGLGPNVGKTAEEMKALNKAAEESRTQIGNIEQVWTKLGDSGKYSRDMIMSVANSLGIDLKQKGGLSEEQLLSINQTLDALGAKAATSGLVIVDMANVSTDAFDDMIAKGEELDKGMVDAFSGMTDPVEAFKNSLVNAKSALDVFSDVQSSVQDAASANADAIAKSIQDSAEQRVNALEDAKQAELDALSQRSRDSKQGVSEGSQNVKDAITDSATAEKRAIEDKYQGQIDAINKGADDQAEARKDAAKAVRPTANDFLLGLEANLEQGKKYSSLLTDIIKGVEDPTPMIEFFKAMKPEDAIPLMEDIQKNGKEFKDTFNATLSEVGKVEATPVLDVFLGQIQGKMKQAKEQSANFLKLIARLSQMGRSDLASTLQEMVGQLGAEQAPGALAALVGASNEQLTGTLDEWKHAGVGSWEDVYGQMKIEAQAVIAAATNDQGTLVARLKEITDPTQFLAALQEAGIDATVAGNFRTALNEAMEGVDEEGRRRWDEFKAYIEGRHIAATIDFDVKYGQRLEELIANNPSLDPKVLKELNSAGYSQGSDSPGSGIGFGATGGKMGQGEPFIVGEKGPELFIPGATGFLLSNQNMMKGFKEMTNVYESVERNGGRQPMPWSASQPRQAASSADAKPIVVPMTAQSSTTFTGDIQGANMEEVIRYAERKKRTSQLTGI